MRKLLGTYRILCLLKASLYLYKGIFFFGKVFSFFRQGSTTEGAFVYSLSFALKKHPFTHGVDFFAKAFLIGTYHYIREHFPCALPLVTSFLPKAGFYWLKPFKRIDIPLKIPFKRIGIPHQKAFQQKDRNPFNRKTKGMFYLLRPV